MKPSKLKRHLSTKHATYCNKPKEYFQRVLKSSKKNKHDFEKFVTVNEKYLLASYETSYLIAKNKKPYTIGEDLVLPAAIKMSEIVLGKKYGDEIRKIPLSNNTVSRRISEISTDQLQQLITRLKSSPKFAIQLDETTDISNCAQLLLCVRYAHEGNILEDLLFCRPLEGHTKGEDIYQKVNDFFQSEGLEWINCVGVCTDGAAAMTGKNVGFISKVKADGNNHILFTHCMIHREALVAKKISSDLNAVLYDAVKIINFIKSRALNSRLFTNLCKDMESDYQTLILHAEVRWLSRGRSLHRILQLKEEIIEFLTEHNSNFVDFFHNEKWVLKLHYLSDIFSKLNDLNLSLQGFNCNIFMLKHKIEDFIKKVKIWKTRAENGSLEMFAATDEFITENNISKDSIIRIIIDHLTCLETQFDKYFPSNFDMEKENWVHKPYAVELTHVRHLSLKAQEEFAELSSDTGLKLEFSKKSLNEFWIGIKNEFPTLSEMALNILMPFCTTYMCETAFSALTTIKSKNRSILQNVEEALRPALSNIDPRFDLLCKNKQAHPTH